MLKGRKLIIILLLGFTGLVLLLSVSVPIKFTSQASVPLSLDRTMDQFRSPSQLAKWFHPFAETDSSLITKSNGALTGLFMQGNSLVLVNLKPAEPVVSLRSEGQENTYTFRLLQDTSNKKNCLVETSVYRTLWKRWLDPDLLDEQVRQSVQELEDFTNNTERFYGFPIKKETLSDSCLIYLTSSIPSSEKAAGSKQLFDSLIQYTQQSGIKWSGKRLYYQQRSQDDTLKLFSCTVVPCQLGEDPEYGIGKKDLPAGHSVLIATYEGLYKDIDLAYKSLDQYRRDFSYVGYMLPYEDLLSPGYGFKPMDKVRINICLPIL